MIRFIVGFPAGNTIDVITRIVIDDVRERTGAVIVIENRPGGLGAIGIQATLAAAPDGYTLMPSSTATHSVGPYVLRALENLRPVESLTHFALITRFDFGVVVNSKSQFKNVGDIASASAKAQEINYGYGTATSQVAGTGFALAAKIKGTSVPYKGTPPAVTDLLGGQIDFMAADLGSLVSYVQSGALRPLALLSEQRSTILPDVPTAKELGYGDLFIRGWVGFDGPKGLPEEVIRWWTGQLTVSLAKPEVRQRLLNIGMETTPLFGADFNAFVVGEQKRWAGQVASAGIQVE
jgi:tripartite-type tricarboxylate transporter receptor subunit TctC